MKPIYAIIDEEERNAFEKEWQLPYGYGMGDLYMELDEAIKDLENFYHGYIIEKISDEGKERVY